MSGINSVFNLLGSYVQYESKTDMDRSLTLEKEPQEQAHLSRWEKLKQKVERNYHLAAGSVGKHPILSGIAVSALLAGMGVAWKCINAEVLFTPTYQVPLKKAQVPLKKAHVPLKKAHVPLKKAHVYKKKSVTQSSDPSFDGSIRGQLDEALHIFLCSRPLLESLYPSRPFQKSLR